MMLLTSVSLDRIFWLKLALTLAFMSGILLSKRLWTASRTCPTAPVSNRLPKLPYESAQPFLLLALLLGILLSSNSAPFIFAFVLLVTIACIYDQARIRVWVYQYVFMFMLLGIYYSSRQGNLLQNEVLNSSRLILICIYVWGGLHKFNACFFKSIFPYIMEPITKLLPKATHKALHLQGYLVPLLEASIGLGLLFPQTRTMALLAAVGLHLSILLAMGPLTRRAPKTIWTWNAAMIFFVIILFSGLDGVGVQEILVGNHFIFHTITLVLFGIAPILGCFGLLDTNLCWKLWVGNGKHGYILISKDFFHKLPEELRKICIEKTEQNQTFYLIDVWEWCNKELNISPYSEERVFKRIASGFKVYHAKERDIALIVTNTSGIFSTHITQRLYKWNDLFPIPSQKSRGFAEPLTSTH